MVVVGRGLSGEERKTVLLINWSVRLGAPTLVLLVCCMGRWMLVRCEWCRAWKGATGDVCSVIALKWPRKVAVNGDLRSWVRAWCVVVVWELVLARYLKLNSVTSTDLGM